MVKEELGDRLGDWMATLNDPLLRGPVSAPDLARTGSGSVWVKAPTHEPGAEEFRWAILRTKDFGETPIEQNADRTRPRLLCRKTRFRGQAFLVSGVIMSKVVVLGAGMVGAAMAVDLAASHQVLSVDRDAARLAAVGQRFPLETQVGRPVASADLVAEVCRDADLVVGAVPGFMGFRDPADGDRGGEERRRHLVLRRGPVRTGRRWRRQPA